MSGETKSQISAWNVDTLKEYLEKRLDELVRADSATRNVLDERDRLYKERDEARRVAVDAALTAVKEQTASSFAAAEKAILKAEEAQKEYNLRSNEFRGQLSDQARLFMPRSEAEAGVKQVSSELDRLREDVRRENEGIKKEIASLRETRSAVEAGSTKSKDNLAMVISIISTIISFFAAGLIITRGTP